MSRKKNPIGETKEEASIRHVKEHIYNQSDKSAKISWTRKMNRMTKMVMAINQIQDKIGILEEEKISWFDAIKELRELMISECVHPTEQLVKKENGIFECKFCYKKINPKHD